MAAANADAVLARFIEVYGKTERGQRLWDEWMTALGETGAAMVDRLAQSMAEEQAIPLEEARTRLALEKLVQDRGIDFAEKFLAKRDAAELRDSRALKPMAVRRRAK